MIRLRILLMSLIISHSVTASILPENDWKIPISAKNEGLTEAQYNSVIDLGKHDG
jgi:hypothetical protein